MSSRHRHIQLRIRDVQDQVADSRTIVLEHAHRDSTDDYAAGQFLTLHLPVGAERTISRSYSLSSCPVSDTYPAITIKREPDGEGSNWLFSHARPGLLLDASPASGNFKLDSTTRPILLFAAGVGVTPVFSILKNALRTTERGIHLHYSVKSPDEALFLPEIRELGSRYSRRLMVTMHYTERHGRLDLEQAVDVIRDQTQATVYVCGPPAYIDLVRRAAHDAHLPPDRFVTEAFTPVSTIPATDSEQPDATAHVTLGGTTHVVPWPQGKPLVDALLDHGLQAPFSCRQGECLTCECRITGGEGEMRHNGVLDEEDIEDGYALACQLIPKTEAVHVEFPS
ncbi:iron-sulfur cluster-binding domain-containing protein [Kocuria sp. 2SI]|uniref:iron-sulfur cluster-binding domain-containing protein n=1 Tax=Kocuria sp. 2SI TaxID=2502203 RepID=UPI0010F60560|nr:iron-sulfur cluster-binding domain-containing protein [Kocuria sp. 2SI]